MKKDIQTTSTINNKSKSKSSKRRNLLTATLALALGAALFAPLVSAPASASLDDGGFCIKAVSDAGKFAGMKGNCGVVAPSSPGPVEPSPEPERVEEAVTFLVERVDTAVRNEKLASRSYDLTITRHAGGLAEVVRTKTAVVDSVGYSNNNVVFSSKRVASDLPLYAPSYTIRYDFGVGEVYEVEVKPEHFSKATSPNGRQDWDSLTDLKATGWVRS